MYNECKFIVSGFSKAMGYILSMNHRYNVSHWHIVEVWFYLDWLDLAIIDNYTCIGLMYNIKLKQESLTKECYKIGLSWENLLGVVLLLEC